MTERIHLGLLAEKAHAATFYPEDNVNLEIFHTLFSGQTNLSGKTTTIKTLIPRAVEEGYTVLVFDTKPTVREFEGYHEVPATYRDPLDALVLIGLLESIRKSRLSPYYATLSRLTEGAKTLQDIIENAEEMEGKSRSGFVKDACHTLADLIKRLRFELIHTKTSEVLSLKPNTINVMPLNGLSVEAQQIVVKTAFELALRFRRLILVVDESWRFLPEQYSSACKRSIQDVVTQGAKTKLFVWLATQFLAPTDKDALKAMANKLVGRQDHPTEVKHSQDLIPDKRDWPAKAVMTLKRGEFIFVPMEGETKKIYIDHPVLDGEERTERHRPQGLGQEFQRLHDKVEDEMDELQSGRESEVETAKAGETPRVAPRSESPSETPKSGGHTEERARPSPSLPDTPTPQTKQLAAFALEVTRLESDSIDGKLVFIIKRHGGMRQSELLTKALDYGWNILQPSASEALKRMVRDGMLTLNAHKNYSLPREVTVKEVTAS